MKIVYNLFEAVHYGGIERIVIGKVNWLADHGYDVTIVTTDRRGREPFYHIDERVKMIDLGINYSDDWVGKSQLQKQIKRQWRLRRHRKALEKVLAEINPDVTVSTFGSEVEFLHKLKPGGKKVVEIHFSREFRLREDGGALKKIINRIHTIRDLKDVKGYDAFVCLTEQDLPSWGNLDNIIAIPNFVNELSQKRAQLESKHAIAVGRLSQEKGFDRMIDVWKKVTERHPEWVLDIYGDGKLREELQNQIKTLNLEGKVILHQVAHPIEEKIMESSMLLMTSHHEGFGMVMLEAMSCGVPVVCYDYKCGPRDVLTPESGIIVPNGDADAFAESVCKLIEDEALRQSLGEGSYKRAEYFLRDNVMKKWDALFHQLT